mgnify:CR=1 FL=1
MRFKMRFIMQSQHARRGGAEQQGLTGQAAGLQLQQHDELEHFRGAHVGVQLWVKGNL